MNDCFCSYELNEDYKWQIRHEVCGRLPIYKKDEKGNNFCVLHYPVQEKISDFKAEFDKRIKANELNFKYVWFPDDVTFWGFQFSETIDFQNAYFTKSLNFIDGKIYSAYFNGAKFQKSVNFGNVEVYNSISFAGAEFLHLFQFANVNFYGNVKFWMIKLNDQLLFRDVKFFKAVNFERITFSGTVSFEGSDENEVFNGNDVVLSLQLAKPERPEKFLFYKTRLDPNWFINVDATKFVFTDVKWRNVFGGLLKINVNNELKVIEEKRKIGNSKELLKVSFRQLAENAENNNRFDEASKFRQMAFETEWLEKKEKISNWIKNLVPESEKLKRRFGGSTNEDDKPTPPTNTFGIIRRSGDFFIHGIYRITSFYGESWSWALCVLLTLILVVFPIIYTKLDFQVSPKSIPLEVVVKDCKDVEEELKPVCKIERRNLFFDEAILHSFASATFQDVEYRKPISFWAELWTTLEKIFAPLQAALLALAIRRKFMR